MTSFPTRSERRPLGARALFALLLLSLLSLLSLPATSQDGGVRIDDVVSGGPAAEAGLHAGDLITRIGSVDLRSASDLESALSGKRPGDQLEVEVTRSGTTLTLNLVLGTSADDANRPLLGIVMGGSGRGPLPSRAISAEEKADLLRKVASQLRAGYVFEEKGNAFADRIEKDLESGRFDSFAKLDEFVRALNPYLLELSNDRHLRVQAASSGAPAQPVRRVVRRSPDGASPGGQRPSRGDGVVVRRQAPGGAHGGAPQQPRVRGPGSPRGAAANFGFERAEMLESGVGYIALRGFSGDEASKAAADEAMQSLQGARAVVLDLRQNGGGSPLMVRYLSAFFFSEPTHLASTMMRGMDEPAERWSLHEGLPTKSFADIPLYVLTSRRTFSAAESFTFGLKINDRIVQVGERTGGGGHFGETIPLNEEVELFLPRGRTYDPKTGEGWEAEGLTPDVEVPAADALKAAMEHFEKLEKG